MNAEKTALPEIDIPYVKRACSNCSMRELCLPVALASNVLDKLDELVYLRKRFKAGTHIYHAGSNFHYLYAVRSGFVKLETLNEDGREQVTGFYMMGEILGFDGIATDQHMCTAVALEDSELCVIPFDRIEHVGEEMEHLHHHFYMLMSREIVRDHTMMMLLSGMHGDARIAAFILNLSQRFHERGFSSYDLVLRMKREDIGSYLGMKIETVSRILSKFRDQGLLEVHQKHVRILDMNGLQKLVGHHPCK